MKSLREIEHFDFDMYKDDDGNIWYKLCEPIKYTSHRFGKTCTVPSGFEMDGASGPATDIVSKAWMVHDWNCDLRQGGGRWDDGSIVTPYESSCNLHDILLKEDRWIRAKTWGFFTFCWQTVREWSRPAVPPDKEDDQ